MFDNRREIMQDVFLTYLPAQRFKTSRMTVQLIAPLQRETAAANALLPAVLRRGTVRCPDMESLSAALDTLYGANIDYTVRKKGERQCVGFAADFIDDAFTPHGEKLLEPVSAMLGELLLDPVTHGGRFLSSYVESEKANLIDAIRGLKNDKRDWADIRLMQEMCAGEPYSVLRLGDEETAGRITNQSLYVHGQALMASSRVEVIYCGSAEAQHRFAAIGELACDVLMGESSPLYARLYSQGLINGSFGAAFDLLPGAAYAYAGGDSKDPKAVAEAILDEAQRLAAEGVDGDYYKRIVNANFGAALRELNAFESIAVSMAEGRFQGYDPYRFPEIYDDITAEDVRAFLRENFTRTHMALSVIAPKEG